MKIHTHTHLITGNIIHHDILRLLHSITNHSSHNRLVCTCCVWYMCVCILERGGGGELYKTLWIKLWQTRCCFCHHHAAFHVIYERLIYTPRTQQLMCMSRTKCVVSLPSSHLHAVKYCSVFYIGMLPYMCSCFEMVQHIQAAAAAVASAINQIVHTSKCCNIQIQPSNTAICYLHMTSTHFIYIERIISSPKISNIQILQYTFLGRFAF